MRKDLVRLLDVQPYRVLEVTCKSSRIVREALRFIEDLYDEDLDYEARHDPDTCECQNSDVVIPTENCFRGFIFLEPSAGKDDSAIICGACIFQWHTWGQMTNVPCCGDVRARDIFSSTRYWEDKNAGPCWALQWVWFLSRYRRHKMLSSMWPEFRLKFGEFYIEPSYTSDFVHFLEGMGYTIERDEDGDMCNWSFSR